MKLSVNEAEFTGLCTRNFVTNQQVLILKFAFWAPKVTRPFEKMGSCPVISLLIKSLLINK